MTRILGRPQGYGPSVPLKLVIREDIPYRSSTLGVSQGLYEATWANNRWESGGAELNVTMPRWDKEDAIPLATTHVFISRTDTGAVVAKYDYNPGEWVETATGEFDLGKGSSSRAWVRSRQIEELTDGAHAATQQAAAAADSVTAATLDLQNEKGTLTAVIDQQVGRVDSGLADIAQTGADVLVQQEQNNLMTTQNIGRMTAPSVAEIGAAAGLYNIIAGVEAGQVWERLADGTTVQRTELETIGQEAVTRRIVAETLNALKLAPGRVHGDTRHHEGRTWWWDSQSVRTPDGKSILDTAAGGMGRWILQEREWGLNIKLFKDLVVDNDWIPAINAAFELDNVRVPSDLIITVKPAHGHYIKVPPGKERTLSGPRSAVIRVADGNGPYYQLFGQDMSLPLEQRRVTGFRLAGLTVDQNADNVAFASLTDPAFAVALFDFETAHVDRVRFRRASGVNTVHLNGKTAEDARITDCECYWRRKPGNPHYDNSAFYFEARRQKGTGNIIEARRGDGGFGGIETHGYESEISGNRIRNYLRGVNVVPAVSDNDAGGLNSLNVSNNKMIDVGVGVSIWLITGQTLKNIVVDHNEITVDMEQWAEYGMFGGVHIDASTGRTVDANGNITGFAQMGALSGGRISNNTIGHKYSAIDPAAYKAAACGGVALTGFNNVSDLIVSGNVVRDAPLQSYIVGRADYSEPDVPGGTRTFVYKSIQFVNNWAINSCRARHPNNDLRAVMVFAGRLDGVSVDGLWIVEQTPPDEKLALKPFAFFDSSTHPQTRIELENVRIDAPDNADLNTPPSLPAGFTLYPHRRIATLEKSVAFPAMGAGAFTDVEVRIPVSSASADILSGGPLYYTPPSGLMWSPLYVRGYDPGSKELIVWVRLQNASAVALAASNSIWRFTVVN